MNTVLATNWGDVPTWISAITTLGALVAAAFLIRVELARDRRQVEMLERAEQADSVAVWYDDSSGRMLLRNGSKLPIYNVRIEIFSRAPHSVVVTPDGAVPPGDMKFGFPDGVLGRLDEMLLQVTFTDTAGRSWVREVNGRLGRLPDLYARTLFVEAENRTMVVEPDDSGAAQ